MPYRLESGKLRLWREEASSYRAAAERLHETREMGLDLTRPTSVDEWIVLAVAHAAIGGDLQVLNRVIAKVKAEVDSRKHRR